MTIGKMRPPQPERLARHWANQDNSRQNSRLWATPVCKSTYGMSGVFVEKEQSLAVAQERMAKMLVALRGSVSCPEPWVFCVEWDRCCDWPV